MRVRSLVLALALLLPATAFADPIMPGNGSWLGSQTPIPNPSEAGATIAPFWSGLSWDCTLCGVGYMLENYGYDATRLEYLQDGSGRAVSFRFDWDTPIFDFRYLGGITAWTNGTLDRDATGAFTYDSGTGHTSNSWTQPGQYALFRIVDPGVTTYLMGIEDIPVRFEVNDHDHNDYIVTFRETNSVPEPSTLLLMGCALGGMAFRKLRAGRKTSAA